MQYLTKYGIHGLEVNNFDVSHGFKVGDSIDGLAIEEVYNLPNEFVILFMKMESDEPLPVYQYVTIYGRVLAMSTEPFNSLEEAIDDYDKKNGWYYSDRDCRQKFKIIDENRFLYREDRINNPETKETYVYQELMDFDDYTDDDLEEGVKSYYKNLDEVKSIYGDDWKQIALECIFEQS